MTRRWRFCPFRVCTTFIFPLFKLCLINQTTCCVNAARPGGCSPGLVSWPHLDGRMPVSKFSAKEFSRPDSGFRRAHAAALPDEPALSKSGKFDLIQMLVPSSTQNAGLLRYAGKKRPRMVPFRLKVALCSTATHRLSDSNLESLLSFAQIPKKREWGRPRQGTPCCCLTKSGYVFGGRIHKYIAS